MKKIVYIINHISFFVSHILPIAKQAKKKYKIYVIFGEPASLEMEKIALNIFKKHKIKYKKISYSFSNINIFIEFLALIKIFTAIKSINPDLIHAIGNKAILFGGIISRILSIKALVIFITGMGFLYSNKLNFKELFLKKIFFFIKKFIFKHRNKLIIVENYDDYKFFIKKFNSKNINITLIKGSGVDLKKFKKINNNTNKQVSLFARVLEEKGIKEFVCASIILKKRFPDWKFVVVGALDYEKKSLLNKHTLENLNIKKTTEFLGYQHDVMSVYKKTSIVCLPSYREGLPKCLLEASALGLPIVTTNVIGCRDAIINKKTGLLAKVKNVNSLVNKLSYLIKNKNIRSRYGKNGRDFAIKNFDLNIVIKKNLDIYSNLISKN
jgi:glycosyltransferase involved in cell wall biosynthesis